MPEQVGQEMFNTETDKITKIFCEYKKHKKYNSKSPVVFKKETLAQMFSCEFCEISKNTFFYKTLPLAASKNIKSTRLFTDQT